MFLFHLWHFPSHTSISVILGPLFPRRHWYFTSCISLGFLNAKSNLDGSFSPLPLRFSLIYWVNWLSVTESSNLLPLTLSPASNTSQSASLQLKSPVNYSLLFSVSRVFHGIPLLVIHIPGSCILWWAKACTASLCPDFAMITLQSRT